MDWTEDEQPGPATAALYNIAQQEVVGNTYQHSPLDHQKPSIRLVKVLPELSPDGHIQCEILHGSTKSNYQCLSYVWGSENQGGWITLNGHGFWIRANLWRFLDEARQKPHLCNESLWIDAMCIDQSNSAERVHQVQQMGSIFSGATGVVSWLGPSLSISNYLAGLPQYTDWGPLDDDLGRSNYWQRAWITQEVALARRITFMARSIEQDETIVEQFRFNCVVTKRHLNRRYNSPAKGRNLFQLLQIYQDKKCSITRDRIFSLLALCGDAKELKVNYTIEDEALAKDVLRRCPESFCFCAARVLCRTLNLQTGLSASQAIFPGHRHRKLFAFMELRLVDVDSDERWTKPSATYKCTDGLGGIQTTSFDINLEPVCLCCPFNMTFVIGHAFANLVNRCVKINICKIYSGYIEGCTVEISPDATTCTIGLSFAALLAVASISRSTERICQRVAHDANEPSRTSLFRLCEDS